MTELLSAVLSPQGWYCVVGLKKTGLPKQIFVRELEEVEKEVADLLAKEYDAYFGCAKYETNKTRSTDNVLAIKAFWLDIDCGENKPYATQADGVAALRSFCKTLGLPKPTIVNSGRGLHVYWPLTTEVTRQEWTPVAKRLKALCHEHKLEADPSRTSDAASILRMPDTLNFKGDPPLDVTVICHSSPVDFETFKACLGAIPDDVPAHIPSQANELTRALMGNRQHRFSVITAKNAKGTGCLQLAKLIGEQDIADEPKWRATLSIPAFCVDSATAIHAVSEKHPSYTAEATEEKVQKIKGPYTCVKFEELIPGGCNDCPHKGKITSPIVLGAEVAVATEKDNTVEYITEAAKPVVYKIPEYPFPYFRGKNGGVYVKAKDEDDAVLVYEHDLYVVKRLKDPQRGEVIWMRLHTPRDGVREFALPAVDLLTADKLREKLAWFGVIGMKKQMDAIMGYIVRSVKELQCREGAEIMRSQFGWTNDNKSFVVGDTEVGVTGDSYSPPSSYTEQLSDWFIPMGSLEEWKSVINVYDRPGFEPMAFGFFTAFGAPLMKHLNLKGAIINMINNESGTGKTTAIKAHAQRLRASRRSDADSARHYERATAQTWGYEQPRLGVR
jgi:hypothetical protein